MIFKKPYALLIRYFKLIHIILSVCIAFSTFKMYNLYSFFLNLSKNNYSNITNSDILAYFSPLLYLSILVIIVFSLVIFFLMRFKKKPKIYYSFLTIVNILFLIYLNYSKNYFFIILSESSNPVNNSIFRDISFFVWILSFISIFFSLLRSIGFDIKKFNFKKDIADLKIDELDNEEIEFNINIKKHSIKRNINKNFSIIRDFLKTKKIIFIFIFIMIFLYFFYLYIMNTFVYNKNYLENNNVIINNYTLNIKKSYFTNASFNGEIISTTNKYIVINFVVNTSIPENKLNTSFISLESNGKNYFPVFNSYSYFSDLGDGYNGQILKTKNNNNYILVFKVDEHINFDNLIFKHFYKLSKKGERLYKKIKLNPIGGNSNKTTIINNINSNLSIGNNIINIKSYKLANTFEYDYEFCINQISCITKSNKITEKDDLILQMILNNSNLSKEFLTSSSYITYDGFIKKNNIVFIDNITPKNAKRQIYLKVPIQIKKAKHIYLNFVTREKKYVYVLK